MLVLVFMLAPRIPITRMTMPPCIVFPVAMAVPVAVTVHANRDGHTCARVRFSLFVPRLRGIVLREGRAARDECAACRERCQNSAGCNSRGFHDLSSIKYLKKRARFVPVRRGRRFARYFGQPTTPAFSGRQPQKKDSIGARSRIGRPAADVGCAASVASFDGMK
ncbi:hypothetical protein [Burkholderia sp. Bp8992]|uniref:hypothetical protein n=1 Tax=Burkholderia sp. Bp8992 TaxID=2184554 RepID=UPI001629E268